jgi:starch synthase (maltosyl-transferring)
VRGSPPANKVAPKGAQRSAGKKPALSRVIIDAVKPNIDHGRFAAKCALGHAITIEAVVLCDGHETLKVDLLWKPIDGHDWQRIPMAFVHNDTYRAAVLPPALGKYVYTVEASIDRYAGWRDAFFKKLAAGEASAVDLKTGTDLIAPYVTKTALSRIVSYGENLSAKQTDEIDAQLGPDLTEKLRSVWDDPSIVRYPLTLPLDVDPEYALHSSWYEFFPRSTWKGLAENGNLKDAADRLPYVKSLGFDIVYLPPLHPIGREYRKGKNNTRTAQKGDLGSPWAIGAAEGGHKSIHPELGTEKDLIALVKAADKLDLKLAMDIAFQCAPDHPWVKDHPEWFKKRSDGSIQYAENPPKKYQDIYPLDFESSDWEGLWDELKSVILYWVERGVKVFRVDNPHTKSFHFWEWCIGEIRAAHPEVIFLAEAFTRPHVMAYLAKIGFNQSYTYFAWRFGKDEFVQYMTELTKGELNAYFRPNFWPNTPDILTEQLQSGHRPTYVQRLILAATLSASYGIYGPAFELVDHVPAIPGKEEYMHSEKYEAKVWDIKAPHSLAPLITRINRIRADNAALHQNEDLRFHPTDNPNLIAYTKGHMDKGNLVLVVVNLDAHAKQDGIIDLQIHELGIKRSGTYALHDLLSEARFQWQGWRNYVALDPHVVPAHIFRITQDMAPGLTT